MKILLVAPRTPETFWSFRYALRFVGRKAALPPLGLLTVAGMLPRRWELRLVDLNVRQLRDCDLKWADAVLVSGLLIHRDSVLETAARAQALGRTVIAGGPLITGPDDRLPHVDAVVAGEAEELIERLCRDLGRGELRAAYVADGFPDITRTPAPRWDLVRLEDYASLALQFSRGCPFDCEFCDIVALNGRVPRLKTPAQMVAELEVLRLLGWRGTVFIVDDNFIGNRRMVKELLRSIIGWRRDTGAQMTFYTEASVNLADDPELLQLMVAAGFKKVFLGIETPDCEALKQCRKVQNTGRDLVKVVHELQGAGLEVMGGFIVGFDDDQPDIFTRQFEFIQQAGVVTAMVGLLQAVPRSRLYQRLACEGRLLGESLGDNTRSALNFETRLPREFLIENYRRLMHRLYEPHAYYQRARAFLAQYRPGGPPGHHSHQDVQALFKSLWLLGVVHRGRRAFWRFCMATLLRQPARFGLAITLAIYGHHFRQVSRTL
ncbi:MAG: B12-binding domain-containing radical SAM protein [Candidatus Krumholzibacteriia bacterium]